LVRGGQRLMAWAVANARVEPKGNAIVITKQASETAKIDPLMAAFNAVAWMSANAQHLCYLGRELIEDLTTDQCPFLGQERTWSLGMS
jgi:phage terminase large subunit-like protein